VANGLQTTWNVLAQTRNRAAVPVLAAALRSPSVELQAGAIRASVQRKDRACHEYLIRRFATLSESEQAVLCEAHHDMPFRMGAALGAALLAGDASQCENACRILVSSRDYELFPVLVRAAENPKHRHVEQVNAATMQLANRLHQDLADESAGGEPRHRDPYFLRRQVVRALESAVQNYPRHKRLELLEAFLLVAPSDNPTLVRILRDAAYPCHQQVMKSLSSSKVPAMIERLVELLHDTAIPESTLEIIARRTDRRFLDVLLHGQKQPVALRVMKNMSRLWSVAWLETESEALLELDGWAQAVAVELAQASGLSRDAVLGLLAMLLRRGLVEGRKASCRALAEIRGSDADALVREALADPDGGVQAAAVGQLRQRQFPDSLPTLVALLDSPQAEVREAARSSLAEFNFVRYRAMFELLDEKTLRTTGRLVRKVDQSSPQRLAEELSSPSSSTRRRGIAMAVAMDAVDDVGHHLVLLAEDEDAGVRLDAAEALAHGAGPEVISALVLATQDPHLSVRDAATASLEQVRARVPAKRDAMVAKSGGRR
jgi:HEAT repeat protein